MFNCKACACKDAHIQSLKDEIISLRKMVLPTSTENALPVVQLEADAVLSVNQDVIPINEEEIRRQEFNVFSEASSILSGTY